MRKGSLFVYAMLVMATLGLSLSWCAVFFAEGNAQSRTFMIGTEVPKDAIQLDVEIAEINPAREIMRRFINPKLTGNLVGPSPRLPARDVDLTLATATGPKEIPIRRGHHVPSLDIEIPLASGDVFMYPIDSYKAWIEAEALFNEPAGVASAAPVVVNFSSRNHTMHVEPQLSPRAEKGDVIVRLDIRRLVPIAVFIWFMAGVMLVMTLAVVLVVITVLAGRRDLNFGMLGWTTALLFALPAVRNSLPGVPPARRVDRLRRLFRRRSRRRHFVNRAAEPVAARHRPQAGRSSERRLSIGRLIPCPNVVFFVSCDRVGGLVRD